MGANKSPSGFKSDFGPLIPLVHEWRCRLLGLTLTGSNVRGTDAELSPHNSGTVNERRHTFLNCFNKHMTDMMTLNDNVPN